MPTGNGEVPTNTNTAADPKPFYLGTCAGILRILICTVGLASIILVSIGSPNDLDSFDGDANYVNDEEFWGYGLGYAPAEPFNAIFISLLIIVWILASGFILVVGIKKIQPSTKLNRLFYLIAGILVWIGLICGAVGTYFFWEGCCRVFLPSGGERYLRYHFDESQGYKERCLCYYRSSEGNQQKYHQTLRYKNEWANNSPEILSARPHHFVAHLIGLSFAAVLGILCFVAVCCP